MLHTMCSSISFDRAITTTLSTSFHMCVCKAKDFQASEIRYELEQTKLHNEQLLVHNSEMVAQLKEWEQDFDHREAIKAMNHARGPGGWLPRAAGLVALLFDSKFDEAREMAISLLREQAAIWKEAVIVKYRCNGVGIKSCGPTP